LSQGKVPHYTLNVHLGDPQNWFGPGRSDEDSRCLARPARDVCYNGRLQLETLRHDACPPTERNKIWWALVASQLTAECSVGCFRFHSNMSSARRMVSVKANIRTSFSTRMISFVFWMMNHDRKCQSLRHDRTVGCIPSHPPLDLPSGHSPSGYLPTPCSRALLEKLIGFQLLKKFPAFYGTRRPSTTRWYKYDRH